MRSVWIHAPRQAPRRIGADVPILRVGRTTGNDLVLDEPALSRNHAQFTWEAGCLWLLDLDSRHGSFVNGTRIDGPVAVRPGDEVRLGPVLLTLEEDTRPEPLLPGSQTRTMALADLRQWADAWDQGSGDTLDLLHALSMDLVQEVSPDAMVERLLQRLARRLRARDALALLRDATGRIRELRAGTSEIPTGEVTPEALEAAFQRREASLEWTPTPSEGPSTASSMTVPLEHAGEALGLLHFRSEAGGSFLPEDIRLVAVLGNLVAARLLHQRALDEVQRRQEMERELERREAATRARASFLATLSHEVRAPLQALLGFHRLALGEPHPAQAVEHLRKAEHAGRLLGELVNDILDFSKAETGSLQLEQAPFHLGDVLETVEAMFRPQAEAKGLRLECHLDTEDLPGQVLGDPLRLGQVLINLVGNAVKFTARGSVEVVVTREAGSDRIRFEVADTGIGLSEEAQTRIFEPYSQAEPGTSRAFGGTGLGLSISHQLVALMGGTLSVTSASGLGATFGFTLPLPPATDTTTPERPSLQGRVLVVEDDTVNRELLLRLLEQGGLEACGARTAEEAWKLAEATPFDAVLTDLTLPDQDGLDLSRRLRERQPGLPILVLTGHAGEETRKACAGLQGFLVKPVRPEALLEALEPWLRPQALRATAAIEVVLGQGWEDETLLDELAALFLEHHATAVEDLSALLGKGEREAAQDLAHALKGACLALGAQAGGAAWMALERALVCDEGCAPALGAVARAHNALLAALRARLARTEVRL